MGWGDEERDAGADPAQLGHVLLRFVDFRVLALFDRSA